MRNDRPCRRVIGFVIWAALLCGLLSQAAAQAQNWEPAIAAFERQDKALPVEPGGIVFTGSSSIVRWNTMAEDLKPLPVINRGFGGSQYTDVNQYAERTVVAYRPRIVVVYAGDNDLAANSAKTPQSVAADVQKFVGIVHARLPQTWIYIVSIKPSYLRRAQWPQMKEANQLIQNFVHTQDRVQYIDVASAMFDALGNLPRDLFVEDGLHMTSKGYDIWTAVIKPILTKKFADVSTAASATPRLQP
jgi:lysophospholipase L1-like esterase